MKYYFACIIYDSLPIDSAQNVILFGDKSIRKLLLQSKFGLNQHDTGVNFFNGMQTKYFF